MIGWWTVLDVIKQVKSSARQAGDGDCPNWLAAGLIAAAVVFMGFVVVHGFWSMN